MKILFLILALISSSFVQIGSAAESLQKDDLSKSKRMAILSRKLKDKVQSVEVDARFGWHDARLITPRTHLYVRTGDSYKLFRGSDENLSLQLYRQSPNQNDPLSKSQGLIRGSTSSYGASVDTSVRTSKNRKQEKKATFIQYDKSKVKRDGRDFDVEASNEKGTANYDGGHLVDHKFSAQGSHTDGFNYIPQHHYYNRWLKEYIVKDVEGYLEIPVYTPNPPEIKVLSQVKYDAIPIGIILVTLANKTIHEVYYFPNNQYNYRTLQRSLKITKAVAQNMVPNFKLKKEFHALLWPAVVYDISRLNPDFRRQLEQEAQNENLVGSLVDGMSVLELDDENEGVVATLAFHIFHQENVQLSSVLSRSVKLNRGQANRQALPQAFNALGRFLIEYAMNNAMKSELISNHSRIMFANIITDFIECYHQVPNVVIQRVDDIFSESYAQILDDLSESKDEMGLRDLIYFANLYGKLTSPHIHPALLQGHEMCEAIEDMDTNISNFICILKRLSGLTAGRKLRLADKQNLVGLFLEAQDNLDYLIETGFPVECFDEELSFLRKSREQVRLWNKESDSTSGDYQTSPNSAMHFRVMSGFNASRVELLGASYEGDR